MELYYKDLISEENSLEKLVEDLELIVQGANLAPEPRAEITTRLRRLKAGCRLVHGHAVAAGVATDRFVRKYPYAALGLALAAGLLAAGMLSRKR
jgi:ElaB/YqjD/DUF883 family membrane-anchored ribosome-binding protein